MGVKFEVSAKVGTYTNRDGVEKSEYVNMGVVMDTKNGGLMMKLKCIPTKWDGFAYLNEPKPREERNTSQNEAPFKDDDDIPPF